MDGINTIPKWGGYYCFTHLILLVMRWHQGKLFYIVQPEHLNCLRRCLNTIPKVCTWCRLARWRMCSNVLVYHFISHFLIFSFIWSTSPLGPILRSIVIWCAHMGGSMCAFPEHVWGEIQLNWHSCCSKRGKKGRPFHYFFSGKFTNRTMEKTILCRSFPKEAGACSQQC